MSYQPIENYGVIGDLHTVALVGMDGSLDFMCAPVVGQSGQNAPEVVEFTDERRGSSVAEQLIRNQ